VTRGDDRELDAALRKTLLELTSIPSPIGEEKELCDAIEARLWRTLGDGARITRRGSSLVVGIPARDGDGTPLRIGLVGHLDTVRTEHDGPVRIEGDKLYGPGAADMKAGLALMIELAERASAGTLAAELVLVFYEREEGPYDENMLGPLLAEIDVLRSLDLAICLEPSDNKLQLGCMGSVHVTARFRGRTSHSARPWQGDNAIVRAAPVLAELGELAPRDVTLEGLLFREVITPTMAQGGRGRNIVPDVFEINLNVRFAPGRTPDDAIEDVRALVAGRCEILAIDRSPAGRPHAKHPLVDKLAACGVRAIEPKQAWTDVARFDQVGVPAVNFGPGTQAQAHQRNEYTELGLLLEGYRILERFLRSL